MKRSEMIEILRKWILNDLDYYSKWPKENAESLLKTIEKAGMQAPCAAAFGGHGTLNEHNSCNDYVECCEFIWEPEDETP